MKQLIDQWVEEYNSRFTAPFRKRLEEKNQKYITEVEKAVPDIRKRELLTQIYSTKTPAGSLAGWKRYILLNLSKPIAELEKEVG